MKKTAFMLKSARFLGICIFTLGLWLAGVSFFAAAEDAIDRIVAVVDDGVILESELVQKVGAIKKNLQQNNTQLPPDEILARQVLERMIVDKLQAQMAEKAGIKVDEETLRMAVQQIAQRNHLSMEEFRRSLREEGIDYGDFVEQIRNEIAIGRLRSSQINSQVKVSEREIQHYLETQGQAGSNRDAEYLLGHILIATPQAASPAQVQKAREKADKLMAEIKQGLDFKQAALGASTANRRSVAASWAGARRARFRPYSRTSWTKCGKAISKARSEAPADSISSSCWESRAAAST